MNEVRRGEGRLFAPPSSTGSESGLRAARLSKRFAGHHLERIQEGDQVFVFLVCEPDLESCVVEIDQIVIFFCRTGVEIRRALYETA